MSSNNEEVKLDWMYKDSNEIVDREEYLLGRRLNKNIDSKNSTNDADSVPGSIFSLPESTNKVDALRKIKEDPLEAIKEKEREMRKELLKNPIQMKKIQKMIEAQKKKSEGSEIQKKSETKKRKKKSKYEDNDRFKDENDLDAIISKKLAKLIKKYGKDKIWNSGKDGKERSSSKSVKNERSKHSSSSSSSSDSSDESTSSSDSEEKSKRKPNGKFGKRNKSSKKKSKMPEKHSKRSLRRSTSDSSSSSDESEDEVRAKKAKNEQKHSKEEVKDSRHDSMKEVMDSRLGNSSPKETKSFGLLVPKGARKVRNDHVDKRNKQDSPPRSKDHTRDSRRNRSGDRDRYSRSRPDSRNRQRERSKSRDNIRSKDRKTQINQEEKERRLKEMMDNVAWRNDLMEKNSKRHKDQVKMEESQQDYNEDFARNQMSKGIYSESVEQRIKSKLQNIQRSSFAMDKNFARR